MSEFAIDPEDEPATLVGLLDELLDQGVHVAGDLVLGLADVELVRVALRLLVASEDTVQRTAAPADSLPDREPSTRPAGRPSPRRPASPPTTPGTVASRTARGTSTGRDQPPSGDGTGASRAERSDEEQLTDGVARLVLTVVAVIHDLVERQATRRVEAGTLTDDQVERLGLALQALEERMADVREAFGVTDEELDLDLGPLGHLR